MLFLILIFPLIGAAINGLVFSTGLWEKISINSDKSEKRKIVTYIALGTVLISALISSLLFLKLITADSSDKQIIQVLFDWIISGEISIKFEFLFDSLSAVMCLVVTWVSFFIHVYSVGYMHDDDCYERYFSYLNLFVFFMLLLVLGNNFPLMFVGWEGVGLASYLLIGFWYGDSEKAYAGRKAFIYNRIGDFGFILGILLIFAVFGSLNYQDVFSSLANEEFISTISLTTVSVIGLLLFIGAVGKSAQFPLYLWLPDAMAGPTAVSALIHAATMVTAGVYMVARCNIIYTLSPVIQTTILIIAAFTAFLAAAIALTQNDIKRVLAYSTVSQLGYMFMAAGVGAYIIAIFHLMTHAFFKALLFLGSGSVIHSMSGDQDIRNMGGLRKYIPVTSWTFLIGTLAISGVPFLSGFFSKDEILSSIYTSGKGVVWIIGLVTAVMTAFYMMRLYILTFEGKPRMSDHVKLSIHESPRSMTIPLIILAILSVIGGYIGIPEFMGKYIGLEHNLFEEFLSSSIYSTQTHIVSHVSHGLSHWTLVALSIGVALLGLGTAFIFYYVKPGIPASLCKYRIFEFMYKVSLNKFYVDELYDMLIVKPFNHFSDQSFEFDIFGIDGVVNKIAYLIERFALIIRSTQPGLLRVYATVMVVGITVLFVLFFT